VSIQDLDIYTFTIQSNTDDFEVIDLRGLTAKMDTVEGDISGIDIIVKQLVSGTVVFIKAVSAQSWQVWQTVLPLKLRKMAIQQLLIQHSKTCIRSQKIYRDRYILSFLDSFLFILYSNP
jgi:hypothetical protein